MQYNDLIRCFCTMASLMTFQTSSHFSCFYPLFSNLGHYTLEGIQKANINNNNYN